VETLLVLSKTKDALREQGVRVSGDALDSLNALVHWVCEHAARRAKANGRKTVMGHDILIAESTQAEPPPDPSRREERSEAASAEEAGSRAVFGEPPGSRPYGG